jgi:DNA-binding beta-propeller fold protein YncE
MRAAFVIATVLAAIFLSAIDDGARAEPAASAMSVVATIHGPDGGWDYASVDQDIRRLFVAHGKAVMAVDLDTGKVDPELVAGKRLRTVLPLPDGRALTTDGDNTATLFDAASGKIIASVPTGVDPGAAVFDRATGLAVVMDGRDGDLTLIDPATATSPGRIRVGGRLIDGAVDGAGHAFVSVADRGEIAMIDIAGRKVMTRYSLPGCEKPSGVALDPASGNLIVACANRKALALRAADGAVAAELTIGERPDAAIFDAERKVFFIPCGEGSIAAVSDAATPAVIQTIPTANGARTAALDAKTGRLYLPTADFDAPAPGKKRHTVIPGTFRILTVGPS